MALFFLCPHLFDLALGLLGVQIAISWWNTRRALSVYPPEPKMVTHWPRQRTAGIVALTALTLAIAACGTAGTSTGASSPVATSGASSTLIEAALPLIRTGSSVATGAVLDFAVKQSSTRTQLANEMYAAANAVYSLSGGTFPTTAQFQASILAFGGTQADANYADFAAAISGLYSAYYPKLTSGNTKTAVDFLNAIAGGIEDATAAYVTTPLPMATASS